MFRTRLALSTALMAILLAPAAASAQDEAARLEAIEKQIQSLQSELARVRRDLRTSQTELRQARQQPRPAPGAAPRGTSVAAGGASQGGAFQGGAYQGGAYQGGTGGAPNATNASAGSNQPTSSVAPPQTQLGQGPNANPGGVSFPNGRPTLTSNDGRFSVAVGLQLHYDLGGYFTDNGNRNESPSRLNTFGENLRRGRIPFVFKYDDFQINITPDFGGSPDGSPTLYEANINYSPRNTALAPLIATLGYYKPDFTLQDSMSSNAFLFLERPSIVEASRNIAAGDSRAVVGGRWSENRYFLMAYLTGSAYGSQQSALAIPQQTGGVIRVAGRPIATENMDLHLGFSASDAFRIQRTASGQTLNIQDRPELRIDTNRLVSTGALNANSAYTYGPEFAFRYKNFLIQGEYIRIGVNQFATAAAPRTPNLEFDGGYVEASYMLTGEPRRYTVADAAFNNAKVANPLKGGGYGAFELVARYSTINLNDKVTRGVAQSVTGGTYGGEQDVYGVGVNWYPNDFLRFMLDYNIVNVDRLNTAGTTQIGRRFQDIGFRAQAAF